MFEGAVIVVVVLWNYQVHVIFVCDLGRCNRMVCWLEGNIWVWHMKWERGGSIWSCEWICWKGGWEKVGGLGSELANSPGVSISELLNWEIVLYTVVLELLSDSMLDEVLSWGDWGVGGEAKSGMMGRLFCRFAGWEIDRWRDPSWWLIVC